jgi:hypothetical protein
MTPRARLALAHPLPTSDRRQLLRGRTVDDDLRGSWLRLSDRPRTLGGDDDGRLSRGCHSDRTYSASDRGAGSILRKRIVPDPLDGTDGRQAHRGQRGPLRALFSGPLKTLSGASSTAALGHTLAG